MSSPDAEKRLREALIRARDAATATVAGPDAQPAWPFSAKQFAADIYSITVDAPVLDAEIGLLPDGVTD